MSLQFKAQAVLFGLLLLDLFFFFSTYEELPQLHENDSSTERGLPTLVINDK